MDDNVRKFVGYRGTTKRKVIEATGRIFDQSTGDDEYFGHGIYFFEDDEEEAFFFALKIRQIPRANIGVIKVLIEVESEKVFDLVNRDVYKGYLETLSLLIDQLKKEGKQPRLNATFDCRLINMICAKEDYNLVRGPFTPSFEPFRTLRKDSYTRIPRVHIQLCVRNESIITEIC